MVIGGRLSFSRNIRLPGLRLDGLGWLMDEGRQLYWTGNWIKFGQTDFEERKEEPTTPKKLKSNSNVSLLAGRKQAVY